MLVTSKSEMHLHTSNYAQPGMFFPSSIILCLMMANAMLRQLAKLWQGWGSQEATKEVEQITSAYPCLTLVRMQCNSEQPGSGLMVQQG